MRGLATRNPLEAELIKKMVHSGYVDCLHTYGNFSQKGGFKREMAVRAVRELREQGMYVSVWINHGDPHNFQNILGGSLGDMPVELAPDGTRAPILEYHTDLTIPYGIKFIWKSDVTPVVGQDRRYRVLEHYFPQGIWSKPWLFLKLCLKRLLKLPIPMPRYTWSNNLLTLITLRDGQKVYSFLRFGDLLKDQADELADLISEANLQVLEDKQGYMVAFTHMGKADPREILPPKVCAALRRLAQAYEDRHIYVTTTLKLLNYNLVFHTLGWRATTGGNDILIHIKGIRDKLKGEKRLPSLIELQGITFYTPVAAKTRVFLGEEELDVTRNPRDFNGRESVMIPLTYLQYPDL